ncbi:MAG: hypothetical protein QOJ27_639 [Sphingomonadales bacterium]|jgi:hypothetical protein|nr:hypothetical protein [Sphingomonadales bacterium]
MRLHPAFHSALADQSRLELQLRLADGSPWRLTVSAGIEQFIGYYPRVEGIDGGGPLLRFQAAGPA